MDLFDKCRTDGGYFGKLRLMGDDYFSRPCFDSIPGPVMRFRDREVIMWSINDYLGLSGHPEIRAAAAEALEDYSVSSPMGSRMMSGTTPDHLELERQLAEYAEKEAAFLFNYGYLGVIGTIVSLTGPDDTIVMDKLSHASIVDGVMGSPAKVRVFRHNNMDQLEKTLKKVNRDRKGGVLIVTEGTFGMTGDLANLEEICDLKDRYGARLYIDDAHGFGVIGESGRGAADVLGVQDRVDVYFGTFAKAFAAIGGFSASDQPVIDWIQYNARTQVFAKSLPMIYVKALLKAVDLVRDGDRLRQKMWDNAHRLKKGLRNLGYYVGPGQSPICSVYVPHGDADDPDKTAAELVAFLRENGVFVTCVIYPVIPKGLYMFRMIPTSKHEPEHVDRTLEVFERVRQKPGIRVELNDKEIKKVESQYWGLNG